MEAEARALNEAIEAISPACLELLSELGRRSFYPRDIPFQAAQARGSEINATIGQITDGEGRVLVLPAVSEQLQAMPEGAVNAALRYSPMAGDPELRRLWSRHQASLAPRPRDSGAASVSLPVVTVGLTEGLSLLGDLFLEAGRKVFVPAPFWGNYRQIFGLRRGATIYPAEVFPGRRFSPGVLLEALAREPEGVPVVVVLNFPSNPTGYSPSRDERSVLVEGLAREASRRSILVLCDDAYTGLVFEDDVPASSIFWDLLGCHKNLVPVKVDGATKELVLFGGRVGFLTFPFPRGSEAAGALESKVMCLLRATVGSPVALSQRLVLDALRAPGLEEERRRVREILRARYVTLRDALAGADAELLLPLPFNSGCFALLELPEALTARGVDAETVRRRLLESYDTGVVASGPRHIRLAYCSVREDRLTELIDRLESCLAGLYRA